MSETRIASISGLRGLVGNGLDPVVVVEFAAAYASQCEPGGIVLSHDGRVSSSVFFPAVACRSDRDRTGRTRRRGELDANRGNSGPGP